VDEEGDTVKGHGFARTSATGCKGWRAMLMRVLLGVSVTMTVTEFIEVQKLSDEQLNVRFALPRSCQPALTALTTNTAASLVLVAVECRGGSAPPAGSRPAPGERQPPSPQVPRGS
jgi:hypothetical protein